MRVVRTQHLPERLLDRQRLGRHVEHDPKSWEYPAAITPTPLRKVLWERVGGPFDQGDIGSCFPAGTLIRMADGSERSMEDVRLGEYVVTAEGRTGMVRQTMIRMQTEGLVRVALWGYASLRLTAEHPVLTRRGYVAAGELRLDDVVAMPRYRPADVATVLHTETLISKREAHIKAGRRQMGTLPGRADRAVLVSRVPSEIALTARFGKLVGFFLAEGSTSSGKARWTFGAHEEDTLVAETVDLLRDLGVEAHVQHRANNSINVNVYGTAWARLWERLCGTGSGEKHLHASLASGSDEFLKAVLAGWLLGDGHSRQRRTAMETAGTTVSKRLALAMFDCAQALGLRPTLRKERAKRNRAAATRRDFFSVTLNEHKRDANWRSSMTDSHVWRRVREIADEDFAGYVYNLSVEGDESYVAEGIGVHNCTGNAVAGALNTMPLNGGRPLLGERDALNIYSRATHLDHFKGLYPPDDTGSSGLAACKAAKQLGLVAAYRHAFGINHTLQALQLGPVVTGVNWYEGFDRPDRHGKVQIAGEIRGGHEFEVVGYDPDTKLVVAWNSWGRGWGLGGMFLFTVTDWDRLLHERGDVTVPT